MKIIPFNAEYGIAMWHWYHDPRLSHYFRGFVGGITVQQAANAPALLRAHVLLGVEDRKAVGQVTLADADTILRIYKLGLMVAPDAGHKGVGKELLAEGIRWGFDTMNAHKIFVEVMAEDTRTRLGVERAGFTLEGFKRQSVYLDGKFSDEVVFSMLQSDYRSNK
jgi:RimJ/RimL family protein N-acetyltransferase